MMQQALPYQQQQQQQQQLAALLSAALPNDDSTSPEPDRAAAINALHRFIVYPHNSLTVSRSASFIASALSQLLAHASYLVRQSASVAYGALCAVVCSIPLTTNGRQNHGMLSTLVDQFINWALPLLSNISAGDGSTEVALEGLLEFLNVGDVGGIERFVLPIIKACQELLEDERTSSTLLQRTLGILTLISVKLSRCFQPLFLDIIDLLLGCTLAPDLSESDRSIIMDSFLRFQKHWADNWQFSMGLLSKFLGDMDVLLQDSNPGTPKQFQRLLALLSCFSTVLQSTASGLLEMSKLEEIIEPLSKIIPQLLGCLSLVGQKFGWSKWVSDLWKCLTLLAEILCERFSTFYPVAADILFQSLEMDSSRNPKSSQKISSFQVHGTLKTNLQLLSLQKLGLLPSSVHKSIKFDSPVSQLRLHPNHVVTGSCAATYVFLLQHGNDEVVQQTLTTLMEELDFLKGKLRNCLAGEDEDFSVKVTKCYSMLELFALVKFDLKVSLTCVVLSAPGVQSDVASLYLKRSKKLLSFITEGLDPFSSPIREFVAIQVHVIKTLDRLSLIEFNSMCTFHNSCEKDSVDFSVGNVVNDIAFVDKFSFLVFDYLRKYSSFLVESVHISSPLAVKVAALEWVQKFCEKVIATDSNLKAKSCTYELVGYVDVAGKIISAILDSAYDTEPKVRSLVSLTLELFLQARLVHPVHLYPITRVILEKLADPDIDTKDSFVRLLSHALPLTVYACGANDWGTTAMHKVSNSRLGASFSLHWKQILALKQLPQRLHAQQLVSVLSYISQRWKVPLSSWIQRLIPSCRRSVSGQSEELGNAASVGLGLDIKVDDDFLERICSVNSLAAAWWAVNEAARYCIGTRLRTNLGGPSQTFAALERMLLDIAHVLQLDNEQTDANLSIIGSSGAHLLPMRLLLDFVEVLKKNVYNAYEGSAVLPNVSGQSALFFRANRKVCEEWFSRICEPMMNAGIGLQCYDATIQYCALRLLELKNAVSAFEDTNRSQLTDNFYNIKERYSRDIMRVLRHMSLALSRNHEAEALVGLRRWVTATFSLILDENQSLSDSVQFGPLSWITGLVYQAESQYEKAAAHYAHLLQAEESLSSLDSDCVQFVISRIIESYAAVCDWKSLDVWLLELQSLRAKHAGKTYSGALTTAGNEINAIHALGHFDRGDFQAAWAYLDLTPKFSSELTLDPKLALQRSEQMLLQSMLLDAEGKVDMVPFELQKAKRMLAEAFSILPLDGAVEAASHGIQSYCILAFEDGCKLKRTLKRPEEFSSLLSSHIKSVSCPVSKVCQDCSPWLKVLRVYQAISPTAPYTIKLCMHLLNLARKQRNLMLANRLKKKIGNLLESSSYESFRSVLISNLQYEEILLMHAEKRYEDAFTNLWSYIRHCMIPPAITSFTADSKLKAKACLKLSSWLKEGYSNLNLENIVLEMVADFKLANPSCPGGEQILTSKEILNLKQNWGCIVEELAGTTSKLSTNLCPTMGKSWISYASWCFSQAKDSLYPPYENVLRSCSFSPILVPEIQPERFKLTENESKRVQSIIIHSFNNDGSQVGNLEPDLAEHLRNDNALKGLVQHIVNIIETAAGGPGAESSGCESLSASLTSQVQIALQHANCDIEESEILSLVDIWWSLRKRRVALFGHAACGFIKYLSYSSAKLFSGSFVGCNYQSMEQKTESRTLRATSYVLHILLNYGMELEDVLEPALSTVPLSPWQDVTPQLYARLSSHPEPAIRKQLEGLLMILAKQSPWSIVYPTLVDINANKEKPSEELQHILSCLRVLYPKLVQDVQLMINELENVTVLWEELWLSTLQELHADVMRRIHVLKDDASRVAENATLSQSEKSRINAAKYSAIMAPIIVSLERRLASTSRQPETPHEKWFHKEYIEQLKLAISTFKTPPESVTALGNIWRSFENIATSLTSYQKKSSISLEEVAPQLAWLSSSDVPMPGLEKQVTALESDSSPQKIITIASFSEQVVILSTKTKPKKLVILGSDGQKYTYLLKGREDLRLDARIMQLLQAINRFLHSSTVTRSHLLGIRYYSVIPISGRAGLIQWVDNVISIYSVFKSWQQRFQLAQLSAMGTASIETSIPPPVPRPSDMFYGKIIPALKEKGIRRVISRRDWPHEVKRKVLLDLIKEVPQKLLHQELWCASEGFKDFNSKLKRYCGSVAAMSMVGHILGLGDRHLDNILMDFCTGDVVHIDYNVCFEKGQRLKVPEIVPFRLTQTIEAALGLCGIEGSFRANCEAVLGVIRKNKDVLLMLLEVFVWDPLVEWTRGDFHDEAAIGGEERKGMELAVSLSLFASRVQEIRVPLQEHHDLLLASLPAVKSALEKFADVFNKYELASSLFSRADQERSNLILRETSAKSIVAEAASIADNINASYEVQAQEFAQAKDAVGEKAQEASAWIEDHGKILDVLQRNLVPEVNSGSQLSGIDDSLSLLCAVRVAGVPLAVVPEPTQAQCHDIDREVHQIISELDCGLSTALSALKSYSVALQRILPLNYLASCAVHVWAQIMQLSANVLSSDTLSLARKQAAELISRMHGQGQDMIKHNYDDLCLKVEQYAIEIEKTEGDYAELMNSIGSEMESNSKERLFSTFISYMQSAGFLKKEDILYSLQLGQFKHNELMDAKSHGEAEERKYKLLSIVNKSVSSLYSEISNKMLAITDDCTGGRKAYDRIQSDMGMIYCELEEQVEKLILVTGFVDELQQLVTCQIPGIRKDLEGPNQYSGRNWASIFKTCMISCKNLLGQLIEGVLPDVIRSAISFNSDVMDTFGSLSQIRGSVDTALEQLVDVEMEKSYLLELEQNYSVKVDVITEQQLALEVAAMKGRDHLSWEEAEELASQEEACRAQLDHLHLTWNQRDAQSSSLLKREVDIESIVKSCEHHFQSVVSADGDNFLAALVNQFSELESIDKVLASYGGSVTSGGKSMLADLASSGCSLSQYIWKFGDLMKSHHFFIWKLVAMDSFLDSCIHDIASSRDQNLGFDQLFSVLKKKLEVQLREHINQYLKGRVAPAILACLYKENEHLKQVNDVMTKPTLDVKNYTESVRRVQLMLEEYCNADETARAAKSAASIMRRKISDLRETLCKASLEVVQMEWMHDAYLIPSQRCRAIFHKFFVNDDVLYPITVNLNRNKLLESMQSAMSMMARSVERLEVCEQASSIAEAQLERAMGWACGGPNSGGTVNPLTKTSGIPRGFHDHMMRRQQLMWEAREKASSVVKLSLSILEFEASRDGFFHPSREINPFRTGFDGKTWQQTYKNALTRLDANYHSFTRTEQEWKLAQSNMEAASNGLNSATNELCLASLKAKSASGELQSTVLAMRDCAYEASMALSAFSRVSRGHTALTSECGSMLEEVLAITEDLHDVHSLGKEAAALHQSLMEYLTKANAILLPLESLLSKDVAAMTDAMTRERETMMEISPIHGQAIYQSYCIRIREACQKFKPLVPSLASSVEGLHSMLTSLARSASLHAGNLHEALEGIGESQEVKSQETNFSRSDVIVDAIEVDDKQGDIFSRSDSESTKDLPDVAEDKGWLSPPDSICSSSSESCPTPTDSCLSNSLNDLAVAMGHLSHGSNSRDAADDCASSGPAEIYKALESNVPNADLKDVSSVNDESPTASHHLKIQMKPAGSVEASSSIKALPEDFNCEALLSNTHADSRVRRGKNAYAISVLKRIEMKIDGRDISDNREVGLSEQVDYLLKQATSVDNLCNMYEGWTPWI